MKSYTKTTEVAGYHNLNWDSDGIIDEGTAGYSNLELSSFLPAEARAIWNDGNVEPGPAGRFVITVTFHSNKTDEQLAKEKNIDAARLRLANAQARLRQAKEEAEKERQALERLESPVLPGGAGDPV
jgi:hypothetical protein